jgi:hypothetical protein
MSATLNEKAESIKSTIKESAAKSKETLKEFINSNKKHVGEAIDSNKKIVDSIKEKFNHGEVDDAITDTVKETFGKSIELAEDALDGIINSYTKQMEMNVDFNTKLVDAIKEAKTEHPEKVLDLIRENFEASQKLTDENTKEILDFYNKHTNLAVNFNEKFGENINSQMESLFKLQGKNMEKFASWASDWWKEGAKVKK